MVLFAMQFCDSVVFLVLSASKILLSDKRYCSMVCNDIVGICTGTDLATMAFLPFHQAISRELQALLSPPC